MRSTQLLGISVLFVFELRTFQTAVCTSASRLSYCSSRPERVVSCRRTWRMSCVAGDFPQRPRGALISQFNVAVCCTRRALIVTITTTYFILCAAAASWTQGLPFNPPLPARHTGTQLLGSSMLCLSSTMRCFRPFSCLISSTLSCM